MNAFNEGRGRTTNLAQQQCEPCTGGTPPLAGQKLQDLLNQVVGWDVVDDGKMISKTFKFPDFETGLDFVDEVGELAEQQGHHPELHLAYGRVKVDLCTHKIRGLSENDFIMAAKIDEIAEDADLA